MRVRPVQIVTVACGWLLLAVMVLVLLRSDPWTVQRGAGLAVGVVGAVMVLGSVLLDGRGKR